LRSLISVLLKQELVYEHLGGWSCRSIRFSVESVKEIRHRNGVMKRGFSFIEFIVWESGQAALEDVFGYAFGSEILADGN